MDKVKILVACHKPDDVFKNDVYTPIHVGRAVSKFKNEMSDMIGDDTGDNISAKNPYYSELTAQYWAWKNLNAEYVGLCHYRRYFQEEITVDNVDKLLGDNYDMILAPLLCENVNIGNHLIRATCLEDVYIFVKCIKKISPEYYPVAMDVLSSNEVSPYNMFVMKKTIFQEFAKWQFDILFEMEKYTKISGYTRMKRVFGYMSEMMLTTYALYHHLRIKKIPIVSMIGTSDVILGHKSGGCLRCLLKKYLFVRGRFTFLDENAIAGGLKNDGIVFD